MTLQISAKWFCVYALEISPWQQSAVPASTPARHAGRASDSGMAASSWERADSFLSIPMSARVDGASRGSVNVPRGPVFLPPPAAPIAFGASANISPSRRSARMRIIHGFAACESPPDRPTPASPALPVRVLLCCHECLFRRRVHDST